MTMDKYSQDDSTLLQQLQDEEHKLMQKVGSFMAAGEKTASEEDDLSRTENRLTQVRGKIYELMRPKA